MLTIAVISAVNGAFMAQEEHQSFEKYVNSLPASQQEGVRARRDEAMRVATEERRHREMVEATRKQGSGLLPFVFGFLIGRN